MLFEAEKHKVCAHCAYSREFNDRHVLCVRRGPVGPADCCHHFRYDPLRRQPPPPPRLSAPLPGEAFQL